MRHSCPQKIKPFGVSLRFFVWLWKQRSTMIELLPSSELLHIDVTFIQHVSCLEFNCHVNCGDVSCNCHYAWLWSQHVYHDKVTRVAWRSVRLNWESPVSGQVNGLFLVQLYSKKFKILYVYWRTMFLGYHDVVGPTFTGNTCICLT